MMNAEDLDQAVLLASSHGSEISLVCLENTHNGAGGKVSPDGQPGPGEAASSGAASALSVTGLEAPRIGELAASGGIVLHELTPRASLEEAFLEMTSGSLEFGVHEPGGHVGSGTDQGSAAPGGSGSGGGTVPGQLPAAERSAR